MINSITNNINNQADTFVATQRYCAIPEYLKNRMQWLNWRLKRRGQKNTKVPYISDGRLAKSNDPSTWSNFLTCQQAVADGKFDGIGFAFAEGDGLSGIDLDNCYGNDGQITPWAQEIIDQFTGTYVEKSPSGRGIHIICFGRPLKTGGRKWKKPNTEEVQGIEIYDYTSPRYFTVTGNVISNNDITECQPALHWVYQEYFFEHHDEPKQIRNPDGQVDLQLIGKALDYILPDEYSEWLQVGMALKTAGLDIETWNEWSQKSSKYSPGVCETKWATFNNNKVGLGTLFYLARRKGFRFPEECQDWTSPETFGDPILFGDIETPVITNDFLPNWVRDYVNEVAMQTQTPSGVVAMLVLAVLAACIQKRFVVSPYMDSYTEPLVLWILVLLPPASRKTAILKALRAPIIEWEQEQHQRLQYEIERDRAERSVIAERIKVLKQEAGKAEDDNNE